MNAINTHHSIAIIGGGLGGLATAQVLQAQGIEATIFELEPDRHARTQGGMLDIHDDTGQQALRSAGLFDQFRALIHAGGEAMRILDKTGTVLREEADFGQLTRPEIDRGTLRDLFLDALPADTVRWGCKVTNLRPVNGYPGRHLVELANGHSFTTDLLIGADGAWSKVRRLVSDIVPGYTGVSFIEVDLFNADADHPVEAAIMGPGMLFALGGETGILGHKETDGSLHVYLGRRADEQWIDTVDFSDTAGARSVVLELLNGWHNDLRGLIAHADTGFTPRRIHALPVGFSWERTPGVTLLGDAAHLMSPFAGEGANLALYDGARLAEAIIAHPGNTETALASYERELFPRATSLAGESAESLETIFAADSPRGLVDMFASFDKAEGEK
jgi:2-polyprenyl-6-methoxyphenol hydroxylase-like FAD-dependent oxidoreductase